MQAEIDTDPIGHAASSMKCGHVLTKAEMDKIHSDIVNMLQPSWLTSLLSEFGLAGYGELKADQWRILGTTFLPVSSVCLWSIVEAVDPHSERCCQILDITMSLLSAVAIACSQVMPLNHACLYLTNMYSYLNSLKILFPNYSLYLNHHIALHLPDYLLLYGPVHSWWTFPFEQLIGIVYSSASLQTINLVSSIIYSFLSFELILDCQVNMRKLYPVLLHDLLLLKASSSKLEPLK